MSFTHTFLSAFNWSTRITLHASNWSEEKLQYFEASSLRLKDIIISASVLPHFYFKKLQIGGRYWSRIIFEKRQMLLQSHFVPRTPYLSDTHFDKMIFSFAVKRVIGLAVLTLQKVSV